MSLTSNSAFPNWATEQAKEHCCVCCCTFLDARGGRAQQAKSSHGWTRRSKRSHYASRLEAAAAVGGRRSMLGRVGNASAPRPANKNLSFPSLDLRCRRRLDRDKGQRRPSLLGAARGSHILCCCCGRVQVLLYGPFSVHGLSAAPCDVPPGPAVCRRNQRCCCFQNTEHGGSFWEENVGRWQSREEPVLRALSAMSKERGRYGVPLAKTGGRWAGMQNCTEKCNALAQADRWTESGGDFVDSPASAARALAANRGPGPLHFDLVLDSSGTFISPPKCRWR